MSKMTKVRAAIVGTLVAASAATAAAALPDAINANITAAGCYATDRPAPNNYTCFVSLDTDIPTDCEQKRSVRWDASTPDGQNALSVMNAAYLSGRKIRMRATGNCYGDGYNQLSWVQY